MEDHEFQSRLLSRLPLAEAVLSLFSHVLGEPFLNELFEAHRGRCYEDALRFPSLVYLVRDALLVHGGMPGRASRGHGRPGTFRWRWPAPTRSCRGCRWR